MFDNYVIPLDQWVSTGVEWLVDNHREFFQMLKWPVEQLLNGFEHGLNALHPGIVIAVICLAAWKFSGKRLTVFSLASLLLVGFLGLWEDTMITLAMVLSSVVICTLFGVPLGIMAGRSDRFEAGLRPVLDAMQTTPAFVYLVPIVMLFSVGNVAACWPPSSLPCPPSSG